MAHTITDSTIINMIGNVSYSPARASGTQGAKTVNILNAKTKKNLRVSTPLMLTYGASDYVDQATGLGNDRFNMALAFGNDGNEDTDMFLKNMIELEEKIKADALTYSKEWFGKVHKSAEVVDALWTPMLKYPKDKVSGDYDYSKKPTLRIKLPKWDGNWMFDIYDEDSNKIFPDSNNSAVTPMDLLTYKSNVACIIEFAGIWFINGKFSATWKLVQVMVQRPQESIHGKCFITLKKEDKALLAKSVPVAATEQSVMVEDSDEEEDDMTQPAEMADEVDVADEVAVADLVETKITEPAVAPVVVDSSTTKKAVTKKKVTKKAD